MLLLRPQKSTQTSRNGCLRMYQGRCERIGIVSSSTCVTFAKWSMYRICWLEPIREKFFTSWSSPCQISSHSSFKKCVALLWLQSVSKACLAYIDDRIKESPQIHVQYHSKEVSPSYDAWLWCVLIRISYTTCTKAENFYLTAFGCKRLLLDSGYLADLNRPNMSLKFGGVAKITEEGIETKQGEQVPLDVIIFATGFTVVNQHIEHN